MQAINGQYQNKRVVDHLGRPWQEEDGYDPKFALPQVISFTSVLQTAWQTYLSRGYDEALRDDPNGARFMRNDLLNEALLQERYLAVASLASGVEVEDEKDPAQKAVKDGINRVVDATRRRQTMVEYLMEAVWFGRYASQVAYEWRQMPLPDPRQGGVKVLKRAPVIVDHMPMNGDKINFRWDGTPVITVNSARGLDVPKASLVMTDRSRALELRGSWRSRFILHKHRPRDADFMDPQGAGGIHGVGIRSVIYWYDWLRKEWLAAVSDWCERTGLGVRLWYYQGGNEESRKAVENAARQQSDKTNLLIPRYNVGNGRPLEGIEYVDTTSTGADLLLRLIEYLDKAKERYIVGQSMSGGADNSDGLGGTGRAQLAATTKGKITQSDANALADTLTADWIRPLTTWVYGSDYADLVKWKFVLDPVDPEKSLNAVSVAVGMGVKFKEDDVRGLTGLNAPQEGDAIVGGSSGGGMGPQAPGFQVGHHTSGFPPMGHPGGSEGSGADNANGGHPDTPSGPHEQPQVNERDGEPIRHAYDPDQRRGADGQWIDENTIHPDDHEHLKTLKGMYHGALAPDFDHAKTEAKVLEIVKNTKAPELRAMADKWELVLPKNASKGAIAEAMTRRIFERRAFHLRTQINADDTQRYAYDDDSTTERHSAEDVHAAMVAEGVDPDHAHESIKKLEAQYAARQGVRSEDDQQEHRGVGEGGPRTETGNRDSDAAGGEIEPEVTRYTAGDDSPIEVIRRMPAEQASAAARGILEMLRVRPDLRQTYSVADLAYLEAIAG